MEECGSPCFLYSAGSKLFAFSWRRQRYFGMWERKTNGRRIKSRNREGEDIGMKGIGIPMKLKNLRIGHGYTQEYIGEKLEISQQGYSNYEVGKRDLPARHVVGLAELYHISTDYFYGDEANPEEVISVDAEYAEGVSYGELLERLMELDEVQRCNFYSYVLFLQDEG